MLVIKVKIINTLFQAQNYDKFIFTKFKLGVTFINDIIKRDLKDSYGISCGEITPVTGGWLNKKWKISSDKGDLLIKQYSNERFSMNQIKSIESALQRQIILEKEGISCPYIWQHEGRAIRLLDNEISYMVMEFCQGKMEQPNTISIEQMQSLGNTCALIHKAFSKIPLQSVNGFPIDNGKLINLLWTNYHSCMKECLSELSEEYKKAIIAQEAILSKLTNEFFDRLPKGIAHEDFTPDNMLFYDDCVSVIIDFDRNHYSYIWHDVGRAILSFALENNEINIEKINAFIRGYSQHFKLTLSDIADALRLSWCIEIPWWIQPSYIKNASEKVNRFKNEMLWLTDNWFKLGELLSIKSFK